jgi:hypothetical protein
MSIHEGGCLCGEVRFRVNAAPLQSGYCHCRMCQKNSGAPVVAWVTFPATSFSWTRGQPGIYQSSTNARREFCAVCGSYMLFRSESAPAEVSVNTTSLDDPAAFPPEMHIYAASRLPWLRIQDRLPIYPGQGPGPGPGPLVSSL